MKHGSLFSGIGGFDLAAQWAGWENVFHCEWNPFGQQVLKHYWPNAESFSDINTSDFSKYANQLDILTGGFPCQPFSSTGKRRGKDDPRHLWPRMLEVISTIKPRWVVGENVHGLVNWSRGMVFQEVHTDLEAQGYTVQSFLLPAAGVGAIHKRNRIWFVAYANSDDNSKHAEGGLDLGWNTMGNSKYKKELQHEGLDNNASNTMRERLEKEKSMGISREFSFSNQLLREHGEAFESALLGENDGLPRELDGITFPKWRNESAQAYGNAIVPQVAFQIFKAINEYERSR
jgi:DNA (cytosine-5)-methyltransferase 1